jgi:hypothetical protein
MCTVTLEHQPGGGLVVTMNRDERWGRAPERPPVLHPGRGGGPDWLAPADGERGGTWIGVNADGVVACLLNGYAEADLELLGRPGVPSRGAILPELLARPATDLEAWLTRTLDPTPYPSFVLLVVDRERTRELSWRLGGGARWRERAGALDMVSSSFWRTEEVLAWRRQRFDEWVASGAPLRAGVPELNLLEVPGRREWSPFMTRSFSATRSVTQAIVEPAAVRLRYWRRHGDAAVDPGRPEAVLEAPRRQTETV